MRRRFIYTNFTVPALQLFRGDTAVRRYFKNRAAVSAIINPCIGIEFLQTGTVERFPTLFVSGFFLLAAMIVFIAGIILDVQCYHFQQRFEMEFKNKKSQRGLKDEA